MPKTRYDDSYWRKMTWGWYAVPNVRIGNYSRDRGTGARNGLRNCSKCNSVYSIDTNKGSGKIYQQFNYLGLFKRGTKMEDCKRCKGELVKVTEI